MTREPDIRDYRVDSSKIFDLVPDFQPRWTAPEGTLELYKSFTSYGTTEGDFLGRLLRIRRLLEDPALGRRTT